MQTELINLGINELASVVPSVSENSNHIYNDKQSQFNQYVAHDIIYEHVPNINGGYVIVVDPGPWIDLIDKDKMLAKKYSTDIITKTKEYAKQFITDSIKLAYQIDTGSAGASADSYNLRHLNQTVFSYENPITSISITYLEEFNKVEFLHYIWFEFMKHLKKGFVDLPDEWLAKDTDIFYKVPYYGQIWAYAYNPLNLVPREIIKYIGVFPSGENLSDSFGQRGQNSHYMKNISYNVVKTYRSVYPAHDKNKLPKEHFQAFYDKSKIFKEFIDYCTEKGILDTYTPPVTASATPTTTPTASPTEVTAAESPAVGMPDAPSTAIV